MKIHKVKQNTPEWFDLRNKYPFTASTIYPVYVGKNGLETLIQDKLNEKYFGIKKFNGNAETERGHEDEKKTKKKVEKKLNVKIEEIGFLTNYKISEISGASPDGYIRKKNAGIEIKNVIDTVYNEFLEKEIKKKGSGIKKSYYLQMQSQMAHGNFDFVYFCIDNKALGVTILKILPNKKVIDKMKKMIEMAKDKWIIAEKKFIKKNNIKK